MIIIIMIKIIAIVIVIMIHSVIYKTNKTETFFQSVLYKLTNLQYLRNKILKLIIIFINPRTSKGEGGQMDPLPHRFFGPKI